MILLMVPGRQFCPFSTLSTVRGESPAFLASSALLMSLRSLISFNRFSATVFTSPKKLTKEGYSENSAKPAHKENVSNFQSIALPASIREMRPGKKIALLWELGLHFLAE